MAHIGSWTCFSKTRQHSLASPHLGGSPNPHTKIALTRTSRGYTHSSSHHPRLLGIRLTSPPSRSSRRAAGRSWSSPGPCQQRRWHAGWTSWGTTPRRATTRPLTSVLTGERFARCFLLGGTRIPNPNPKVSPLPVHRFCRLPTPTLAEPASPVGHWCLVLCLVSSRSR